MSNQYFTISKRSESLFKDRGSKFIGLAYPVNSEDEVKTCLNDAKERYADAGHHCYAMRLHHDHSVYRYSDDGEPNNSAGAPIYGQIQSYELTNTLIVVVRYFGGTKLGVGGLINAYREAAKEAIANTEIHERHLKDFYTVGFSYDQTSDFKQLVHQFQAEVSEEKFDVKCESIVAVLPSQRTEFEAVLKQKQISFNHLYIR